MEIHISRSGPSRLEALTRVKVRRYVVKLGGLFLTSTSVVLGVYFIPAIAQSEPAESNGTGQLTREEMSQLHREAPVPPPAVIPEPSREGIDVGGEPVVFGDFISVQVNVDEFGNNIPGDAANETSIAIDPTNPSNIVIGWRQFDTISSNFRQAGYAYSHDAGKTWTFPGVLDPGQFRSDPVLDSDSEGNIYYYSLSSIVSVEMFISSDKGVSWDGPYYGFGGDKEWMIVDRTSSAGAGNIYCNWNLYYSCCPGDFTRSRDGGVSFIEPVNVPQRPYWGTMTVTPNGILYVVGIGTGGMAVARSPDAYLYGGTPSFDQVVNFDLGGYVDVATGPNPGGLLGQLWIASNHSDGPSRGNLYVLASVNPPGSDPLDVMFTRSSSWGVSWSAPVRVNDDPTNNGAWQWFGTMSVAPNGRIDAIWNDTRNTGSPNLSQVFYSFSEDEGVSWSENIPVTPVFDSYLGWPQQSKIGDYYHMVSDVGGVNLAYAATFNGEQDVYFLRIAPLKPPLAASGEHAARKNRFISIDPTPNGSTKIAVEVRLSSMKRCSGDLSRSCRDSLDCTGGAAPCVEHPQVGAVLGWLSAPGRNRVVRVVESPVYRFWFEDLVHVGDCQIVPVASYELRSTPDGVTFSDPLVIGTIRKPDVRHYGDVAGGVDVGTGEYTRADGFVNIIDIQAYLHTVQNYPNSSPYVHRTWVDLHGLDPGTAPNYIINIADLQRIKFGFQGRTYTQTPEQLDPADCP